MLHNQKVEVFLHLPVKPACPLDHTAFVITLKLLCANPTSLSISFGVPSNLPYSTSFTLVHYLITSYCAFEMIFSLAPCL